MLRAISFLVLAVALVSVNAAADDDIEYKNPLSNGFGDDVEWVKWDDAIELAMEVEKPIFLLIHKTWCHACKTLKKSFQQASAQKAFTAISKHFVMVNTEDDDEPWEEEYKPDGKYIPRILFLDKNGEVLTDFKNTKAAYESYKYYYANPAEVITAMKEVLKKFGIEVPDEKKGAKLMTKQEAKEDAEAQADGPRGPKAPKEEAKPKEEPKASKEEPKIETKDFKEDAKASKEEPKAPSAKPPGDAKPADAKPADKPSDSKDKKSADKKDKKDKKKEL